VTTEAERAYQREYRAKNRERIKAQRAAHYEANRARFLARNARARAEADPVATAAYQRQYAEKNADRLRIYRADYCARRASERAVIIERWKRANPERVREIKRRWKQANPDKVTAATQTRRARMKGAEGHHTAADIAAIRAKQDGRCANAKCRVDLRDGAHLDHIKPISRGGSNWPANLQWLCPTCNLVKGDR